MHSSYNRGYPQSAAAASRQEAYQSRTSDKPPSGYKQSCLPVDEKDSALLEIEGNRGVKLSKKSFRPGMIISAALHEQDYAGVSTASDTTATDQYKTGSMFGTIHTKYRKMIVLVLLQEHCVATPLFSHNRWGLENKPKPDEFVSVRDHRSNEPFQAQSKHKPLVTESMNSGINPYHPLTTAHFTYPVSRK